MDVVPRLSAGMGSAKLAFLAVGATALAALIRKVSSGPVGSGDRR